MNNQDKRNWMVSQIQNFIWLILIFSMLQSFSVRAEQPVVHALLFYSDTCQHCHKVMSMDIPPLIKKYGQQLRISVVNIRQAAGNALYHAAIKQFNIPNDRLGVPTMIVGNKILVGSGEIPELFPKLIESFLAQGGVNLPAIPGLSQVIASAQPESPSIIDKVARDPIGNGLAIFVLICMLIVVLHTLLHLKQNLKNSQSLQLDWFVPVLALLGLAVASYMAYIETAQVSAVCGPIGDCNTVQQSEYAYLFGIPLGVLGVVAYLTILLVWAIGRQKGRLALFVLSLSGTLFSIYLTFLEPFVIGATCAWCLASAIIMTALLWRTRAN